MNEGLVIENLCIGQHSSIVKNIDLQIAPGERLGLVGESGSGKSLTALSIAGLLPKGLSITEGSILLRVNDEILELPKAGEKDILHFRRKHIGFVFQEPMSALNPVVACGKQLMENLEMGGMRSESERKKTALRWLVDVGLHETDRIFQAYPHELSGGQRQRLMIAMAMCNNPHLLIADEPTTALDVEVRDKVLDVMIDLCKRFQTSLLLISHDLRMVSERCEKISVMQKGEIIETGDAEQISLNPQKAYTKALWDCRPDPDQRKIPLPTVENVIQNNWKGVEQSTEEWIQEGDFLQKQSPLLKVEDLHFSYGSKKIINGLEFDLFPGESLGFVGPSGCGKSTLSRVVAGLEREYFGKINLIENDRAIDLSCKKALWRGSRIQMIFQDALAALNPNARIGDMLDEVRRHFFSHETKEERTQKIERVFAEMQLPLEGLDSYPHSFSGGQRQRICIARALLAEPKILICDESVAALDVSVQAHILNLLNKIREEKKMSFLFISHDPNVVSYFCHRILFMDQGRIVNSNSEQKK
jgi:peptide/nickel transport system ATP-binding protein